MQKASPAAHGSSGGGGGGGGPSGSGRLPFGGGHMVSPPFFPQHMGVPLSCTDIGRLQSYSSSSQECTLCSWPRLAFTSAPSDTS